MWGCCIHKVNIQRPLCRNISYQPKLRRTVCVDYFVGDTCRRFWNVQKRYSISEYYMPYISWLDIQLKYFVLHIIWNKLFLSENLIKRDWFSIFLSYRRCSQSFNDGHEKRSSFVIEYLDDTWVLLYFLLLLVHINFRNAFK